MPDSDGQLCLRFANQVVYNVMTSRSDQLSITVTAIVLCDSSSNFEFESASIAHIEAANRANDFGFEQRHIE